MKELEEVNQKIVEQVKEYAKKNGITYEEAAKRARITIGGIKIQPFEGSTEYIVEIEKKTKSFFHRGPRTFN